MCDKEVAKEIFRYGVDAVMPKNALSTTVEFCDDLIRVQGQEFGLKKEQKIHIFGSGKAAVEMAKALLEHIPKERVAGGLIVSNYNGEVDGLDVMLGSHPIPTQKSIDVANEMLKRMGALDEDDFFIYLLSGGSSALMELPAFGLGLGELEELNSLLLKSGMKIDEINVVRKYFSQIKGGGLASKVKANGLVLTISDVIGDDLHTIGSAPMLSETKDIDLILKIVDRYKIFDKLPKKIQTILSSRKEASQNLAKIFPHFIIASNRVALQAAKKRAKDLGFKAEIVTDRLEGDVKDVARYIINSSKKYPQKVLLFGGEPTVVVKGSGKGGRNSELTLWVLKMMDGFDDFTFLSGGSDGIDGNSDAAGGVVCREDLREDIDSYLANNDSYHYLKRQNSLLVTKESGTNVMDIMIFIRD